MHLLGYFCSPSRVFLHLLKSEIWVYDVFKDLSDVKNSPTICESVKAMWDSVSFFLFIATEPFSLHVRSTLGGVKTTPGLWV